MSFADRNVGPAKAVTFSGYTISGTDSAAYALFADSGTSTAAITPAPMTVTAQTDTKQYNGTTNSTVLPLITSGSLQTGDTTTNFSQAYNNANAGVGKTLTPAGIVNDGNLGANYAYTFVPNITGVITPKSVTIAGTAANDKGYNGNTLATLSNIGAVTTGVGAETLVLNGPLAANINFNTKDVATANLVTGTGYSLSNGTGGGLASNYALTSSSASAAANITPKSVNLSGSRTYNGTANIGAGALTIGSLVGSETLSLTGTGTVASRNVGLAKPLTLGTLALGDGTGLASNYTFTGGTRTVDITQALLTLTAQTATKAYDGTTSSSVSPLITTGALQTGDTTTTFAQTYDNANAGTGKTLTPAGLVNDGNSGANYAYTYVTDNTGAITPASVTIVTIVGTVANNKVYDGNTLATLSNIGTVTTGVGSETLVLNGPAAANINFNSKDVATANLVTGTGYSISDGTGGGMASNYALSSTSASAAANITPKSVNLSGSRTYNGTANIGAGALTVGSLVGSETLTLTGTGTVASRNVGLAKPLTLGTLALGDGTGLASNYTFTGGSQTAGITQALMTVTAQTATKGYDATTSSAVLPLITSGALQTGDTTTTFAQTYDNANAGVAKTLTPVRPRQRRQQRRQLRLHLRRQQHRCHYADVGDSDRCDHHGHRGEQQGL